MGAILVATDGSSAAASAVREAISLARARHDSLLVLAVVKPPYPPRAERRGLAGAGEPRAAALAEAERVVAEAVSAAEAAGVGADGLVARGLPAAEICRVAKERDARMIVIGTHGRSTPRRFVFGSVSTAVLHHSSRPVLVVPGDAAPAARRLHAVTRRG